MSRLSIGNIITSWAADNGDQFPFNKGARRDAILDVFNRLRLNGYEDAEIAQNKVKKEIMAVMVGHRSKYGKSGVDRWKSATEAEYKQAYHLFFPFEGGDEPVTEFATEASPERTAPDNPPEVQEREAPMAPPPEPVKSDIEQLEDSIAWREKFRKDVKTTPVEDDDDFMSRMGLK